MGNFYVNYTLRGPDQQAVAEALAGRSALVTPARHGCVVVYVEESDSQNKQIITDLGARLSRELRCPVLAILNHDDDILWYQLFLSGALADEYDSSSDYFTSTDSSGPIIDKARKLCAAFGARDVEAVATILRKSSDADDGYTFEVVRHGDLVRALESSTFAVGGGYRYVSSGNLPEGLKQSDLIKVT